MQPNSAKPLDCSKKRGNAQDLCLQKARPIGLFYLSNATAKSWRFFCKFFASALSNMVVMARTSDDRLLVEQFKQGDIAAFERIVSEFSADIAVLANRLLGWPGEVEDVVQDVFLAAFMGLKKFRGDCSLKSWLFTITINSKRSPIFE